MIGNECHGIICSACNGSGYDYFDDRQCEQCQGAGGIDACSEGD
jgi:DnaJ-class molecular chaperone